MIKTKSVSSIIEKLQDFWRSKGCKITTSHFSTIGAGTLHPDTVFSAISSKPVKIAYLQPSIRPGDGNGGEVTSRLFKHHQFQVLLKPFKPIEAKKLYLESLEKLGMFDEPRNLKFIGDDWKNPAINAVGLGWEVSCDGLEISQFTYMQKIGGIDLKIIPCELAYGIERIALILQNQTNIMALEYDDNHIYKDVFGESEKGYARSTEFFQPEEGKQLFAQNEIMCNAILSDDVTKPSHRVAYEYCLKACDTFNYLDGNGCLGYDERDNYLTRIRQLAKRCCERAQKCEQL